MENKCTLVVLAAGMGSRYGGTKQLDEVSEAGESIMDFSVFDAIRAGFTKIVFIVRKDILEEVKKDFDKKLHGKAVVEYVCQDTKNVPDAYKNNERTKPWGTAHALLVAKNVIHENFCVVNADDFYGFDAYKTSFNFLKNNTDPTHFAMIGYPIQNTLSENGSVSRGQCFFDANKRLQKIIERTSITKKGDKIVYETPLNTFDVLPKDTLVSMNFWAFSPLFFTDLEKQFSLFLDENYQDLKSEFLLPTVVDSLIQENKVSVSVLKTNSQWMGVTYKEDKAPVVEKIKKLIAAKVYPSKLW